MFAWCCGYNLRIKMQGLALRLGQLRWVKQIRARTNWAFNHHLLLTNTSICITLSGFGDILQQRYEILKKRQTSWDPVRTKYICLTGLAIGPTCHYWYLFLDRFFPGRALRVVVKKVLLDQIVFSPINISLFVVMMGYLEGMSAKSIKRELRIDGPQLLKAEWLIWPPAQMLNFYFLPTKYRVLFDNTVSLGFDYYYSYVKFRKDKYEVFNQEQVTASDSSEEGTTSRLETVPDSVERKVYHHIRYCNRSFSIA